MFEPCCLKSNYKMSSVQNVMLRVTIVFGMMVAVVAILYLTPLPDRYFLSCDRPCHHTDWPMICRVKLEIAENASSHLFTVNGASPGPEIHVCQNDVLVVDVTNRIQGHSLTVHWRGQLNNEAPHMDGVPLITQCPIPSYTTFQYKFRASTPGTHLYHAFSTQDRTRGVFGALVVRQPPKIEPQKKQFDWDNHTVLISEKKGGLRVGAGPDSPVFKVSKSRSRFRVAYVGDCPVSLSIDNHTIVIIGLDGNPLKPVEADSVVFGTGERIDFVLVGGNRGNHFLRVKSCKGEGLAVINYEGGGKAREGREGRFDTISSLGAVKSLEKIPERLKENPEKVLYLSLGSRIVDVDDEASSRVYSVNNLTFSFPPSPLLTQLGQVSSSCDELNIPEKCKETSVCECVHVEYIPLGAATELILINRDDEEHVFHLHGYRFYVVGYREFFTEPLAEEIKSLNSADGLFSRNFNNPAVKDTIRVAGKSVVALRFLANNPGFWMLRDEKSKGWTRGMDIVFQVGKSADMVSAPSDFPTCGNYIGPDFFLM